MKKKTLVTAGIGLLSILALSACGNDSSETSADTEDGKTRITWLNILHTASPPNDTIVDKIEEKTNTELTFNWIPDASKEERLTTALASNELGDIVTLQIAMLKNSSVRNALKSGVFWDVSDYLADYKNLSKISEDRIEAASIDGALYGVPMQKDYARAGLVIRKDWLDNLGLEVPDTLDELYGVAKQFTENDPDGNGVDDTVGFGDRAPSDIRYTSFKLFTSYYGAPNGWKVESNGKFTPEFDTDEYKKAMDFSRDLFENGYLVQDFAVTQKTDQQEQFAQGKTGIYTGMIDIKNLKNMGKDIQPFTRPIEGVAILGRETAIQEVYWTEDYWLRIKEGGNEPREIVTIPTQEKVIQKINSCFFDDFAGEMKKSWNARRCLPNTTWCDLTSRYGYLRMLAGESLQSTFDQHLLAIRQTTFSFIAQTKMEYEPKHFNQMAGLLLFLNEENYYYCCVTWDEKIGKCLRLLSAVDGHVTIRPEIYPLRGRETVIKVVVEKTFGQFYVKRSQDWKKIGAEIDVQTLTGGFTGNFVGIGVHDLNVRGGNCADFDYFNYQEIEME